MKITKRKYGMQKITEQTNPLADKNKDSGKKIISTILTLEQRSTKDVEK